MLLPALRAGTSDPAPAIDYAVIVTGGELLSGAYPDTHTHFLTRTLRPMGFHCVASVTVDDRRADILNALAQFAQAAPLIIVTGGLGPTANDITRETLAEFTGLPLQEHGGVLASMEKRLGKARAELPENQRRQCLVPVPGDFLPNANGTAVGLVFDAGARKIIALPGPPRELEPMVRDELVPWLERRFGVHSAGCSLLVRFVGIGQSAIDQTIKQQKIAVPPDVILQSQFEGRRVDFTFALPRDTPENRSRLATLKEQLIQHLGSFIYAFDASTLEQLVLDALRNQGKTLAVAEAGTGGALAASLLREPAARQVLAGACSAPQEQTLARILRIPDPEWDKPGTVADRAERLASAAAAGCGSDWAIAIGEPEPTGKPGEGVASVVLKPSTGPAECLQVQLRGPSDLARANAVTQVLNELRLRLARGEAKSAPAGPAGKDSAKLPH